jgi:hypothetical protein
MATENMDKLTELIGKVGDSDSSLNSVILEVRQEIAAKRKSAIKELVLKALDIKQEIESAERQYLQTKVKCDKSLGKILARLTSNAQQEDKPSPDE